MADAAFNAYESLSVSNSAVGLTAALYGDATTALIFVESQAVRFRLDGTDPTASVGAVAEAGSYIKLTSHDQLQKVRFIRRDGSDATLRVLFATGYGLPDVTTNFAVASNVVLGQVKITDGVTAAGVFDFAGEDALAVAIVDASGNQITSFGGGTQYTEGDTDSSITGTAVMWEDTSDTLRAVSAAKPLPVNVVAGGAGDGAILDGVSSSIKATVFDYTNANPLAVVLRDTNGDYVSVGGGTQYTEDDAAAANPVGNALIMVRDDALSGQTTTDGDNVAARGTDKGELYVKHVDAIPVTDNGSTLTIDGTVTAELSATDNAVLDNIDADLTTIIGHVDGLEGLLTTIDADTSALVGTVSGSELQVDIVSMPAVDTELTTADLDTGGGTDTRAVVGLVGSASGGGQLIPGSSTDGLLVNLGANNDVVISDGGNTITVDGTVAVTNAGLTALNGAISGTEVQVDVLTMPTTTVQATNLDIRDLTATSDSVAIHGDVGAIDQLDLTNSNPVTVAIVDGDGTQITSFGGGTQYTEGDTDASITGTAVLMEGAGNALVPLQGTSSDGLLVNLGANNDVTVTGTVTANLAAGTNNIGDVDVLSIAAGTNSIGNVGLVPRTSGGMTIFRSIDIDESEEEVKGSAGQLFSIHAMNLTNALLYLKFYNATAANVTVGTTTPVLTFPVPANNDTDGAGFVWNNEIGYAFGTAISVACTTGLADNDTGAPAANACVINLGYA